MSNLNTKKPMTFAEYIKSSLKSNMGKTIDENREKNRQKKANLRNEVRASHRIITDSPIPPTPFKASQQDTPSDKDNLAEKKITAQEATAIKMQQLGMQRLEQLKRWKEERNKKLAAQRAQMKPVFKACVHVDKPFYYKPVDDNVYNVVAKDYKFKAPKNVKPIPLVKNVDNAKDTAVKSTRRRLNLDLDKASKAEKKTESKVEFVGRITRSGRQLNSNMKCELVTRSNTFTKESTTVTVQENAIEKTPKKQVRKRGRKPTCKRKSDRLENLTFNEAMNALILKGNKINENEKSTEDVKKTNKRNSRKCRRSMSQEFVESHEDVKPVTRLSKVTIVDEESPKTPIKMKGRTSAGKTPKRRVNQTKELPKSEEKETNLSPEMSEDKNKKITKRRSNKRISLTVSIKTKGKRNSYSAENTPELPKGRTSAGKTPRRRSSRLAQNSVKKDLVDEDHVELESNVEEEWKVTKVNSNTSFTKTTSESEQTPERPIEPSEATYISPFVTVSRGKTSLRKENAHRLSRGEATSVQAGSQYFYKLLSDEITRIQDLCKYWELYRENNDLSEEACNIINVPLGQSTLLINKKMSQFKQLIDKSVTDTETEAFKVTCTDLHGFWDTIMIQVENLNKRFTYLDSLKDNNWEEILPQEKIIEETKPKLKLKKRVMPTRAAKQPASKIRDAIRAARKKHLDANSNNETKEFNGGFFNIKSPIKEQTGNQKDTLLRTVLENRRSLMSPGLEMIHASRKGRKSEPQTPVNIPTPKKSILKLATPKSTAKKSVNFTYIPEIKIMFDRDEDYENNLNFENLEEPDWVFSM